MKDIEEVYDAIVIGAGIGGLSCALHLAKSGKKVAVFEQHSVAGGSCSSFKRKGFTFDAGAHIFSDLNRIGLLNIILKLLDINFEFIRCTPDDRFIFPEFKYELPEHFDGFKKDIKEVFNNDSKCVDEFFKAVRTLLKSENIDESLAYITYEELMNKFFSDSKTKKILSAQWLFKGLTPNEMSSIDAITLLYSYWYGGSYYPIGGSQKFSDALVNRLIELGGRMAFRSEVKEICVKDEKVSGVILNTGEVVKSKIVVNNGAVKNISTMLNESYLNADVLNYIKKGRQSISLFTTYWGIKADYSYVDGKSGWHFNNWDLNDKDVLLVTIPTLMDPSLAPCGHHIVETFSYADTVQLEYFSQKKAFEMNKILDKLERIFGDFKDRVIVSEASTPATIEKYTMNSQGSVYGWAFTKEQAGKRRMDFNLGITGLYQVGHWTKPGAGITPVVISGRLVARQILGQEGLF